MGGSTLPSTSIQTHPTTLPGWPKSSRQTDSLATWHWSELRRQEAMCSLSSRMCFVMIREHLRAGSTRDHRWLVSIWGGLSAYESRETAQLPQEVCPFGRRYSEVAEGQDCSHA